MKRSEITPKILHELLSYDPTTGRLFWKKTNSNRAQAGSVAGCRCKRNGYTLVRVNNLLMSSHRIVWKMVYGETPDEVDHIDGNRSNNRLENLRVVTRSGNNQNRGVQFNNTSGVTGVCFDKSRGKWSAKIQINGKAKHLGRFPTIDDAAAAYADAKEKMHPIAPFVVTRPAFGAQK